MEVNPIGVARIMLTPVNALLMTNCKEIGAYKPLMDVLGRCTFVMEILS